MQIPEVQLLLTIALNTAVVWAAWRLGSRLSNDRDTRLGDCLLLTFVTQYACVALPGLLGCLNLTWIMATAIVLIGVMLLIARSLGRARVDESPFLERISFLAGVGFIAGFIVAMAWHQRSLLPIANDTLTYHFPAAAKWLDDGRISLFQTWNFNPANTFSPLGGSIFITWWVAPFHSDILARFVQAPPVLLIALGVMRLARALGAGFFIAILAGVSCVVSQPIVSQSMMGKDDLYLTAFFIWAVVGMSRDLLSDRLGVLRVFLATGLMLSIKYTALFSLPVLLLTVDSFWRERVRFWRIGVGFLIAFALAGTWYVRNYMLTGDPFYPVDAPFFGGIVATKPAEELQSMVGLSAVLFTGTYSLPPIVAILLLISWLSGAGRLWTQIARDSIARIMVLGPVLGILIFRFASPFPEVRFVFPVFALLFAAIGALRGGRLVFGTVVLIASIYTCNRNEVWPFVLFGLLVSIALVAATISFRRATRTMQRKILVWSSLAAGLCAAGWIYIDWNGYTQRYKEDDLVKISLSPVYGKGWADAWVFVRSEIPANETIAYVGTYIVHPLLGSNLDRKAVYISPAPTIESLAQLPRFERKLAGDELVAATRQAINSRADEKTWRQRLAKERIRFIVVAKDPTQPAPAELDFIRTSSDFQILLENVDCLIARLK